MQNKAIILDIDGVLLDSSKVLFEIYDLKLKGDEMWDYFYKYCNNPEKVPLIKSTKDFINLLDKGTYIILSTARNEKCRRETEARLKLEQIPYTFLYMRKEVDLRPSPAVKKDHLHEIAKKFNIITFIDDDLLNCQMAKAEGILSFRKV